MSPGLVNRCMNGRRTVQYINHADDAKDRWRAFIHQNWHQGVFLNYKSDIRTRFLIKYRSTYVNDGKEI